MANTIQLLYPCDPFDARQPDEMYADEHQAARATGLSVSLYSHEDLLAGERPLKGALLPDVPVVLRGWMLPIETYARLFQHIQKAGTEPLTLPDAYWKCHHMNGWYSIVRDHTPDTVFTVEGADYAAELSHKNWAGYFVKDYVKSLSTGRGSVCHSASEITEVVEGLRHYRGQLEGGVAIRELESFVSDSEERHFVFQGKPFSRSGEVPTAVQQAASRIDSPLFSVDTVRHEDGRLRIVELGDGQVSDRKNWSVTEFLAIFGQS
jgi:hypothetical protein